MWLRQHSDTDSGPLPQRELGNVIESLQVTPASLLLDNHSTAATHLLSEWNTRRTQGKLVAVRRCSDSRLVIPAEMSVGIPVIAATTTGEEESYTDLYNFRGVNSLVILTHIDGDTVTGDAAPTGCGGLAAKAQNMNGVQGIERFIGENVDHHDPIVQAWITGLNAAEKTDKPILIATQDHTRGVTYPLAGIFDGGRTIISELSVKDILFNYNPERIYQNGIPTLDPSILPDTLQEFLAENNQLAQELRDTYRDFRTWQKTQNPRSLVISTDIRPPQMRYPRLFSLPGTIFEVRVPRSKIDGSKVVNKADFDEALDQAQYPIAHFNKLRTVIIKTASIEQSAHLAEQAMQRGYVLEWYQKSHDHQIIIAGTTAGRIDNVDYFIPQLISG